MLSYKMLDETAKRFGESFYLLDRAQIKRNYEKLINAFQKIYKDTSIAYSYKTNYIPQICKVINELGGGGRSSIRDGALAGSKYRSEIKRNIL